MASIEQLKGSDGSGNANLATIQSSRSPGATTIDVDTVLGINPAGFAGSMGTPHTFTDPITSEEITVISEETCVDFTGHVDGTNLEIDDIAPGYVDAGSEVGDVVIIRPTTQYSDNLAEVLEAAHDDDGTLKDGAVHSAAVLADDVVTSPKLSGIAKDNLTTDSNPYKFSVYRNAAMNSANGESKIPFDTEVFDTNNNFDSTSADKGRYTAPVAGFYQFQARASFNPNTQGKIVIYKNGVAVQYGTHITGSAVVGQFGSWFLQLAATDYVEIFIRADAANALEVGAAGVWFSGYLVCRT